MVVNVALKREESRWIGFSEDDAKIYGVLRTRGTNIALGQRDPPHLECDMVTIETIKNGPYIVTGEVELKDGNGNKFPVEKRMALCRCGASTEKPFCDGTHSKIGFQAAEKAVPESKE
jgi:CDGSH-type Zn-finger protein